VCATVFASLNLERVSVSIGVHVFRDVPLFLALIIAYIAGALCVLPFALVSKRSAGGKDKPGEVGQGNTNDSAPSS